MEPVALDRPPYFDALVASSCKASDSDSDSDGGSQTDGPRHSNRSAPPWGRSACTTTSFKSAPSQLSWVRISCALASARMRLLSASLMAAALGLPRSEERRVGKECGARG